MVARASGSQKTKTKPKPATKSAFVKSLPRDLPAKAVVAKAKEAGITLTANYVYLLRSRAQQPRRATRQRASSSIAALNGSAVADFRRLVVNLGVARAEELLSDVKRRLEGIIAGNG